MAELKAVAKPGANEEVMDWVLYDLVVSGTTASAKKTFFNNTEAGQGIAVTNMETAGQLPSSQRMQIEGIEVILDVEAATGDVRDLLDAAVLDFYINNKRVMSAPLSQFPPAGRIQSLTRGSTDGDFSELDGPAHKFQNPVGLLGGVPFKVDVTIGKTAASATSDITVMLRGQLIRSKA